MLRSLERAFEEASKLPEAEQEALADWILEELASERRWQRTFEDSTDVLGRLADEAMAEHRRQRTRALDPDRL